MSAFVLDANVAIAWYLTESFSPAARRWQARLLGGEIELVVPTLHYWEVGNVLRTYVKRGELERELAAEIYALHLEAPLEVAEPDRERVLATAFAYGATAYDAVYISLAIASDAPLVTAEKTTTPWVVKLGKRARPVGAA